MIFRRFAFAFATLATLGLVVGVPTADSQDTAAAPDASAAADSDVAALAAAGEASARAYLQSDLAPFLTQYCVDCHNEFEANGEVNFEAMIAGGFSENREHWNAAIHKMTTAEMPPPNATQPPEGARERFAGWLEAEFDRRDSLIPPDPGPYTPRRLNRTEYNNSVRDLLGIDIRPGDEFPPDNTGYGFDNIADVLSMSPLLMERYLKAAERSARAAIYGREPLPPNMDVIQPWYIDFANSNNVKFDYDETGLSLSSSQHAMHYFPADGEYLIRGLLRGNRTNAGAPVRLGFWIDGELLAEADATVSASQEVSGQFGEARMFVPAGEHWLAVSVLRLYEGLPAAYGGPNPFVGTRATPQENYNPEDPNAATNNEVDEDVSQAAEPASAEAAAVEAPAAVEAAAAEPAAEAPAADVVEAPVVELPADPNDPSAANADDPADPADGIGRGRFGGRGGLGARGGRGRGGRGGGRGGRGGLSGPTDGFFISNIDIVGPFEQVTGPEQSALEAIYVCGHFDGQHDDDCIHEILEHLATRAYRRPVTDEELSDLLGVYSMVRETGDTFEEGLCLAIQKILISPYFLFRIEGVLPPAQTAVGALDAGDGTQFVAAAAADAVDLVPVNDFELASRLSYFLWSSLPDNELMDLAAQGRLRDEGVLEQQVRRMIASPRADELVNNFGGQWLQFRGLESHEPERKKFQEYTEYTRLSMQKETELYFAHVMREDRSILEFLDSDYTFLNRRLAEFYGIPGPETHEWEKVQLPEDSPRGGVLTQGSVLVMSSYSTRTSPVIRGKWVLENLLNSPPPAPPANVPVLDEEAVGVASSLREQLEIHRANAICASCHARLDPLGFGLENFDAIGAWRDADGGFEIDPSGKLPDGREFNGPSELKELLLQEGEAFAGCMVEKMLIYALGRGLEPSDRLTVKGITQQVVDNDYKFSSVVLGVVNSLPFQNRRGSGETP